MPLVLVLAELVEVVDMGLVQMEDRMAEVVEDISLKEDLVVQQILAEVVEVVDMDLEEILGMMEVLLLEEEWEVMEEMVFAFYNIMLKSLKG